MKPFRAPRSLAAVLVSLAALTAPAAAQRADSLVQRDLAFAEGLVERYHYTDLAEAVIDGVVHGGVSDSLSERVALAKSAVLSGGARFAGDAEERRELYRKALDSYSSFLDDYPFSELAGEAERSFVDLSTRYGRILEDGLAEAVGPEAEALRGELDRTLEAGLERAQTLIETLEDSPDLSPSEKSELYRLMLSKGQMLTTRAITAEDGTYYFARAEETLEDLTLRAGEYSPQGLQAFLQLAKAKSAQGDYAYAAEFARFVVDFAVPTDPAGRQTQAWRDLTQEERQNRWQIVQVGTVDWLDALNSAGETEKAVEAALYYVNAYKSEGFTVSGIGYLSLLSVARTLLDAGGYVGGSPTEGDLRWFETEQAMAEAGFRGARNARSALDLALSNAQEVNEANRGNVLQIRAQQVISEAISRPGVDVSPDVLFEAAQGELLGREYARALDAFKRLVGFVDRQDEATRLAQMPRALNGIGRALEGMDRSLEAAMAYREAVTTWKGDPEYHTKNAEGYYRSIGRARADASGDGELEQLYLEAEGLLAQAAAEEGGAGTIHWRRGERYYGQGDYAAAREEYEAVEPADDVYEKARMKAALTLYKEDRFDEARERFERYLTEFVPDPANVVSTKDKLETRAQASAMATYYLGLMASKDGDWQAVVRWLANYDRDFGDQGDYAPAAMRLLLKARIALDDLAAVRDVLERMRERYGDHPQTGAAAAEAARALSPRIDAAVDAGNDEEVRRLKTERAQFLALGNSLDQTPSYPNLRNEAVLWLELREWEKAEAVLRRIAEAFGGSKEYGEAVTTQVLPDLGLALLEEKRVPEAFEVLDPLVPDPDDKEDQRKPSSATVESWCRAVSGWVEGDADTIVEVPGVGDEESLADAGYYWLKLTNVEEQEDRKWECEWYRLKFLNIYTYYRWGALDSKKTADAKRFLEAVRVTTQDPEFKLPAERCGDQVLRKRYLWLWEKVR